MAWPPATHQDVADDLDAAHGWASSLHQRLQLGESSAATGGLLWVPGRYYSVALLGSATAVGTVADRLHLLPMYRPAAKAIDRVCCNVSTAGTAGHVARLGVYGSDQESGLPAGPPIVDAGTTAVDTTGVKELAVTATLHGLVWLAFTAQSGSFNGWSNGNMPTIFGGTTASALNGNPSLFVASVPPTSALPNLTGATFTYGSNTSVPSVSVRAA